MSNILIPGVMRCGTTSLRVYLSRHPSIAAPRLREVDYFTTNYDKGKPWYQLQLGKGGLDKSPNYLADPVAHARIARDLPDAKCIVLLRNPVERAWSHYRWLRRFNLTDVSFRDALYTGDPRKGWYPILKRGHYAEQLSRWFQHVPRENTLIVQSEKLFERTCFVYDDIIRWLDLSPFNLKDSRKHGTVGEPGPIPDPDRAWLEAYYRPHDDALWELLGEKWEW